MKIAMITFYTMIRHLRDKRVMIAFILMPIVMIAILGAALDNQFTPKNVKAVDVGFISMENEQLTSTFREFLGTEEVTSMLNVISVDSYEDGITAIKKGEFESLIYIPVNNSQNEKQMPIEIYSNKETSVVVPIIESFVRVYNLNETLIRLEGRPVNPTFMGSNIEETKIITEGKIPSGVDYYSISTLFQCMIMGAIYGVFAVTKDLGNYTYTRLTTAPIKSIQITFGKLIGSTLALFLVSVLIFLVSKFLYKANWNADLWLILSVLLLIAMIAVSIGMILAFLTRNTMISALMTFIISFFFTFVAGGFSPMEGAVFEFLSQLSPNTYGRQLLSSNIYDGILDLDALLKLLVITGVTVILTLLTGRRKLV